MSRTFKDETGRSWEIAINVTTVKRVRDSAGVDLLDLLKPGSEALDRLATDAVALFDVLCAVLRPQLQTAGLTDEQFGEALDEDAVESAGDALLAGIIDFFRPAKREPLHRARKKINDAAARVTERAIAQATDAVEAMDAEALITGGTSTSLPASSASTPAP